MYVTNIENILYNTKIYRCNGIIASWLIQKNIPLLGKTKSGEFCFMETKLLEEVLDGLPFWYKITKEIF